MIKLTISKKDSGETVAYAAYNENERNEADALVNYCENRGYNVKQEETK